MSNSTPNLQLLLLVVVFLSSSSWWTGEGITTNALSISSPPAHPKKTDSVSSSGLTTRQRNLVGLQQDTTTTTATLHDNNNNNNNNNESVTTTLSSSSSSRRSFLVVAGMSVLAPSVEPQPAEAIGPVKIDLENPVYSAKPCPKDRPIPGEKAMQGMRGLCVTVDVDMKEQTPKDLEKVGVYGYVTYDDTGESVLANNPDLSTDAGQFAMIESVSTKDKKLQFEFIAAIPKTRDISQYENGIGNLEFGSLRIISFPGGQQYGSISPCEMNEFSDECESWEAENGPYEKGDFMVKSNPRTKGR